MPEEVKTPANFDYNEQLNCETSVFHLVAFVRACFTTSAARVFTSLLPYPTLCLMQPHRATSMAGDSHLFIICYHAKMLLIKHTELHCRSTKYCINQMFYFVIVHHTRTHPKGLTSGVSHTPIFAYQDAAHQSVHFHYKPSENTQPDIHTLPSRLPLQHSKHSCQNSGTSNTSIVRWLGRARERQREKKRCSGC